MKNSDSEKDNNTHDNNNPIIFPDAATYSGLNKGCDNYLDDKQFLAFANTVAQFEDDQEKATICMEYTHTYCFTTAQVMKLGVIISDEASRYIFFKTAYEKVYDKDNYLYVKQLLQNDKFIFGINNIYEVPQGEKPHPVSIEEEEIQEKCVLSEEDFTNIKSEVRKESFSTTRLAISKKLIPKYNCISSEQVKYLLGLLSLEADKIELAKFAYAYTLDPQNYTLVRDYFTSQESRDEISKIISN
ncbi:MAG: hypothetical protein C0596_08115 [Marinilabiliales bacterium]|nr:MAG: hypothetical protein C0596_08115 [Marinilabiliales bacterium]